jgi:hypothetical protein
LKRSAIQGRVAWLDVLIESIRMGIAAMILQLFSRTKEDRYDSDLQLRLMSGLLLGTVGLLLHPESRTLREIQSRG